MYQMSVLEQVLVQAGDGMYFPRNVVLNNVAQLPIAFVNKSLTSAETIIVTEREELGSYMT